MNQELTPDKPIVFYDGECGTCHQFVKFVIKFDKNKDISFSPLQGETIKRYLNSDQMAALPDSVVYLNETGQFAIKSLAITEVLKSIGGFCMVLGKFIEIFPMGFRNIAYDFVARNRKKLFAKPADVCPMVPEELRKRFLP